MGRKMTRKTLMKSMMHKLRQTRVMMNLNRTLVQLHTETRLLVKTRKSCMNKKNLAFEVDDCSGRIVGDDSQCFITKGGCVMRKFAKLDGTTWKNQPDLLKRDIITKSVKKKKGKEVIATRMYEIGHYSKKTHKMVNEEAEKVLNELRTEEANSTLTPAQICLKQLKHIPGHIKGCSASTRNILGNEKLRLD
ncbi:hypothetical protein Tco_0431474 [Tanacetum coccineum]